MPVGKGIDEEIVFVRGLKALTSAYEEISVMRMGRVRGRVVASRNFREGLMSVFSEVRVSYKREIARALRKESRRGRHGQKNPGRERSVAVLVSTDEHWSGTIAHKVLQHFLAQADKDDYQELIVMGSVGRDYLTKARPQLHFTYLKLPDKDASLAQYKPLMDRLKGSNQITVSYGKFVNVVEQIPIRTSLAGLLPVASQPESGQEEKQADRPREYLFEPSLPAVLAFFDSYIFSVLFQQTVNESGLAQLGSRITAMEQASQNIDERLKRLSSEHLRYRRAIRNQKQRERLAGMALWGA